MSKKVNKEAELKMLYDMLVIRRFEEKAQQQYQMQKIGGFLHLYIGQEAVAVGSVAATRPDDYMITAYRDHGHALARGMGMNEAMAEIFGKATGCSKGLGGSMHYFDKARNMMGGHAIVGGHVPLGAGFAFAARYRGEDRISLCYMGDGAINIGAFHEALNMAALWRLPAIFICENNQFAMGTAATRSNHLKEIADRGAGYNMKSVVIDGMDVREVRDKIAEIATAIRKEPEPYWVECRTYRYRGHSMSDPGTYRTKEELEKHKKDDPITNFSSVLIKEGLLTDEEFKKMDAEIKALASESVKFAESSPDPDVAKLHDYTFVENDPNYQPIATTPDVRGQNPFSCTFSV
ncbi:MAG: pyruvate dehydrogenase (acetyl-transferring) E1 component subunit alpha [Verrucomicrobia bacterium]|nr:pyruvate dehydrogenase (acetyl-transferring) E1 component subunit alpha [Verrucomicrobiota bacterium]